MASEPRGGNDGAHGDADLRRRTAFLEQELELLRAKVSESPRHMRLLEDRLAEAQAPSRSGFQPDVPGESG